MCACHYFVRVNFRFTEKSILVFEAVRFEFFICKWFHDANTGEAVFHTAIDVRDFTIHNGPAFFILLLLQYMTAIKNGTKIRIIVARVALILNIIVNAPINVIIAMNKSSGPWCANSPISNKSFVIRLIKWPVFILSKNVYGWRCTWLNSCWRISVSILTPSLCPK